MKKSAAGYSLIEMLVVIALIGVVASIWSSKLSERNKVKVASGDLIEVFNMVTRPKNAVTHYYRQTAKFPLDNDEAELAAPQKLAGNRVSRIEVSSGAIHFTLGRPASDDNEGKILSFRPAVVSGLHYTRNITWLCGYTAPVEGMVAVGENRTNIGRRYLPRTCRGSKDTGEKRSASARMH